LRFSCARIDDKKKRFVHTEASFEKDAEHLFRVFAPRRSALAAQRASRTFAGREVFSPTYTPPEKMVFTHFRRRAAELGETFLKISVLVVYHKKEKSCKKTVNSFPNLILE
ncbi:MAG: hypothetical protein IJA73_02190, partial [Oscillospiraceae bacterium]|nr:hypothetical protein [Oscillospiraceae bacterium]